MQSTKERISKMKEQEALMDFAADVKLAIYYGLVHKEEYPGELTIIENDYSLSVKYNGKEYTPYKLDTNQEIVFAYIEGLYQEQDEEYTGKKYILVLPKDFQSQLEDLKKQDEQLNQKHQALYKLGEPTNKARIFLLIMAWVSVIIGITLFLEMFSYNAPGALLILIGSLSSAAILFALAEIINLLQKK